jgi:hypothetical protein
VRDNEFESGVLVKHDRAKLTLGGKWSLYAVITNQENYASLLKFCDAMEGAPYKSEFSAWCCSCCCAAPIYTMHGGKLHPEPVKTGARVNCSGLVASALVYAKLVSASELDPNTATPAKVVAVMEKRSQMFVRQDSIPPHLLQSKASAAKPSTSGAQR